MINFLIKALYVSVNIDNYSILYWHKRMNNHILKKSELSKEWAKNTKMDDNKNFIGFIMSYINTMKCQLFVLLLHIPSNNLYYESN